VYAALPSSRVNSSAPLVCRHDRVTREAGRVGLRRKKNIVVSGNMDKKIGSVGRFFFYNGASKYTKLLHTFFVFVVF